MFSAAEFTTMLMAAPLSGRTESMRKRSPPMSRRSRPSTDRTWAAYGSGITPGVVLRPTSLAIGSRGPDFRLVGVDGQTYSLASFKSSKALAVIFTAVHCPTAEVYEDRIKARRLAVLVVLPAAWMGGSLVQRRATPIL